MNLDPVDEAVEETFPASDAPAWNHTHAGAPLPRALQLEPTHEVLRTLLRSDAERLSRRIDEADSRRRAREEVVSRAMLDAGRAVIREPVDDALRVRTVESEQLGVVRDASCVIVGARYDADDVSGVATLLGVARGLAGTRLKRSVRFVAFADAPDSPPIAGSARYAERLWTGGVGVHAMISLARIDLMRDHDASLLFVGNLRSASLVRDAGKSFGTASHIRVRSMALPSWLPGVRASDQSAFWDRHWPALMVTDGPPWRARRPGAPDIDRIAAALPGLIAVVRRLAGGSV